MSSKVSEGNPPSINENGDWKVMFPDEKGIIGQKWADADEDTAAWISPNRLTELAFEADIVHCANKVCNQSHSSETSSS